MKSQIQILNKLHENDYNIVTCGYCAEVLLIDLREQKDTITCSHCSVEGDISDFPDIYT